MPDFVALAREAVSERHADQRPMELAALGALALRRGCETVLEIGTYRGGSAWYFAELGMDVTSIDRTAREDRVEHPSIRYIVADTGEAIAAARQLDLVFIDGDHRYFGVRRDYLKFAPCARKLIALHDICPHPPEVDCKVDQLWREIRAEQASVELIDPTDGTAWAGIGVLFVDL